jgi:hypothetical protein
VRGRTPIRVRERDDPCPDLTLDGGDQTHAHRVRRSNFGRFSTGLGGHAVNHANLGGELGAVGLNASGAGWGERGAIAIGSPNFATGRVRWTRPGTIHLWAFDLLAALVAC